MRNPAPIAALFLLLLLPVLYVASYLALVQPTRQAFYTVYRSEPSLLTAKKLSGDQWLGPKYTAAYGNHGGYYLASFFWPLEQIDRRLRPESWDSFDPDYNYDRSGL